jgi:hypothetical protein
VRSALGKHACLWGTALVVAGLSLWTGQHLAHASHPQMVVQYSITGGYRQAGTLSRATVGSDYGCQVYRGNPSIPSFLHVSYHLQAIAFAVYRQDAFDLFVLKGFKAGLTRVSGSRVMLEIVVRHHLFVTNQDDKQYTATVTLSPNGLSGSFRAAHLNASHGTDLLHLARDHYFVNVQGSWRCTKASILKHY